MDRFVPANPEAELAVLGSLLIDPDALVDVMAVLKPEDFYSERHQLDLPGDPGPGRRSASQPTS